MDAYGRLTRAELRDAIRRRTDMIRANIADDGSEDATPLQLDPLVSNVDLDLYINSALIKRHIDVTTIDETIMADEATIDIVADQVEYELPPDLLFLRAVYLKDEGVDYSISPPNERTYLYELDQDGDINLSDVSCPTYRRRLNTIVLNNVPERNNPGGLVVDYVKGPLPLASDDQVLETPLAWILQEVIILDVCIYITDEKMKIDSTALRRTMVELEARLNLAALAYSSPKLVRLASTQKMALPPIGMRRARTWAGR